MRLLEAGRLLDHLQYLNFQSLEKHVFLLSVSLATRFDTLAMKGKPKDGMTFMAWVRLQKDDDVNTIYSSVANDVTHNLYIASSGGTNAYLQWTYKKGNNEVFSLKTGNVIPSGA